MRVLSNIPLVLLTWDEMCEMMNEIPRDRLLQLSWFRWNIGELDKKKINYSKSELYNLIYNEIEMQV